MYEDVRVTPDGEFLIASIAEGTRPRIGKARTMLCSTDAGLYHSRKLSSAFCDQNRWLRFRAGRLPEYTVFNGG